MSKVNITQKGLKAIANADFGGFKLTINRYAITAHKYAANETPGEFPKGKILHQGKIGTIEVLTDAHVSYECLISPSFPVSGRAEFGEVVLYLDTGEIFAIASASPAVVKDAGTTFSLGIVVAAAKQGGVIAVTVSDKSNISRTGTDYLPSPKDTVTNAIITTDSVIDLDSQLASATFALRIDNGGGEWSFVGFKKVCETFPEQVFSPHGFVLEPNYNGFWVNNGETLIVQIVDGLGAGQVRKFKYNTEFNNIAHLWECDPNQPLASFSKDSKISIWRDSSQTVPDRRGVPSTQVLFAGENNHSSAWDTSSPVPGRLKIASMHWTAMTTQSQFEISSTIPQSYSSKNNTMLFINGELQPFNNYSFYDNLLVTAIRGGGDKISLYIFYREDSDGGKLLMFEELLELAKVDNYQGLASFNLPIVVNGQQDLIGFNFRNSSFGYEYRPDWYTDGARLIFSTNPESDTLSLVFGYEEALNWYTQPRQYEWIYNTNNNDSFGNMHLFKLSYTPTGNFVLFVKGKLVPKRLYKVHDGAIRIHKRDITIVSGDYVRFVLLANQEASSGKIADISTAPVKPNKVMCNIVSTTSASNTIALPHAPINDNYVLVFVNRLKQERNILWKMQGTNAIRIITNLPQNYNIDIVYFYEEVTNVGHVMENKVFTQKTKANQTNYTLPFRAEQKSTICFADTLYLHKQSYLLSPVSDTETIFQILETPVPEGVTLDFVSFQNKQENNSRTDLLINKPIPHIGLRSFNLESSKSLQKNSLLFVGPAYMHREDYKILNNEVVLDRSLPYSVLDPKEYDHLGIEMLTFASGRDLINLDLELAALAAVSKPARNTGPYWADPAGINRNPNKMSVSVATYISGISTKYQFIAPSDSKNIMVFVHGTFQNPDVYSFVSLGEIVFKSKIPDNCPVDIVTFQTVEDEIGYELDCKVFETTSNLANNYSIGFPLTNEENVFVFVEGVYYHKGWYKIVAQGDRFTLTFNSALIEDLNIEVVIWNQVQKEGSYTECVFQRPDPTVGARTIVLKEEVERKNLFVFAGPVYQGKSTFKVSGTALVLDKPIDYQFIDPINFREVPTLVMGFRTGLSKSRLVTRDELQDNYLTKHGGNLQGPLYTTVEPESDAEVANKKYVDRLKTEVEQLRQAVMAMQGVGKEAIYAPTLSVAPNILTVGSATTIKISNASPGKSVELEVRGSSGAFIQRSIKGTVKLDGTFTLGPVGIDNGYSDYLTVTAWVDGFKVANTADVKITDGRTISGPAMISIDKEIYAPYDFITFSIADATPGGRVTWSTNGAAPTTIPAGQAQFISNDGTWSMQIPSGGIPTSYAVELFVDSVSIGSVSVIVAALNNATIAKVTFSSTEIYRDEVLDINITNGKSQAPVAFAARALGMASAGSTDTAGIIASNGELNFGMRFVSPGDYVIYITIDKKLYTHALKVKQISPSDPLITQQPEGYRAYIKQY